MLPNTPSEEFKCRFIKMATGIGGKNFLDKTRSRITNDVDSNSDLFLAASLQFLHRLLAERTLQHAEFEDDDIPISRMQAEDMQERKSTPRQLYLKKIKQIEEYDDPRLRGMENFFSTILLDPEKSENVLNKTRNGELRNFECTKQRNDSCDFIRQNPPSLPASDPYSFSNCHELSINISKDTEIKSARAECLASGNLASRKIEPNVAGHFSGRLQTRADVLACASVRNDHDIQSSASYVDIVRNAVSGLAKNCGNCVEKYKSRRKKIAKNSWLPVAGVMESSKEDQRQRGYETELESEISSESNSRDGKGSDIRKEIPLRVQLAMESDDSPRKPVTLLVQVPKTVFNLLNRKISKKDTKISSEEARIDQGKRKRRLTSIFRNLLKGRKTPSSTTVYSARENLTSRVTLASEESGNDAKDCGNDYGCNTLIYTLQKTTTAKVSCENDNRVAAESPNDERESIKSAFVPPTKCVNGYEKVSLNLHPRVISHKTKPWNENAAGSARRKVEDDKAPRTEMMSSKPEIAKDLRDHRDEKIIPLRCSEASPQLGNKPDGISQRDVESFLKFAKEKRKPQVYQDANGKHVEIPVEIKTTETPLRLHKTENISCSLLDDHVFHLETKSYHTPSNGTETEQFLQMLVETLAQSNYFPQSKYGKSSELPSPFHSLENGPPNYLELLKHSQVSALEILLRHIATGTSSTSSSNQSSAEKDTVIQTAPKRQLSKISVCYSSESSSESDQETPEHGTKDSTATADGYRAHSDSSNNDPRKPGNQRYFHNYPEASENESLNSSSIQAERKLEPCDRTEVIIEEQNCDTVDGKVKTQIVMDSETRSLSIRETEKTVSCRPVLSRQIYGDRKELANAMIRWWGPQINYSTSPSSQTQLSAYSVSINNFI